jgi:hypothetical protein
MLMRLLDRVVENVFHESQCDFRHMRFTVDMVFTAHLIQEKCREQHKGLYIDFIDLPKAFDTVSRDMLWRVLERFS